MSPESEIRSLLEQFQEGYTRRDPTALDSFMDLFTADAEVIGTNAVKPSADEWYTGRVSARELVRADWEGWGDLRLNLESASVHARGEVGWIAVTGTVTEKIGGEYYSKYLNEIRNLLDEASVSPEQKLLQILRGGTNAVYELRRGETFVWPIRLTAVAVKELGDWKFAQMCFSFPTTDFPDVRESA